MSDKSLFVDWGPGLLAHEVRTICVSRWIGHPTRGLSDRFMALTRIEWLIPTAKPRSTPLECLIHLLTQMVLTASRVEGSLRRYEAARVEWLIRLLTQTVLTSPHELNCADKNAVKGSFNQRYGLIECLARKASLEPHHLNA